MLIVTSPLPVEVLGRVRAVYLGHEMANERLLIESGVVGTQEVESRTKQTVVVELYRYIGHCVTILYKTEPRIRLYNSVCTYK